VEELPRRSVLVATTNDEEFLSDSTGSRRFWPVRVTEVELDWIRENRDQLWAEAVALFDAGEQWWLDEEHEALRAEEAVEHQESDPWEDPISRWLKSQAGPFVVGQVLEEACGVPVWKQSRPLEMRAAEILGGLGCEKKTLRLEVGGVRKVRRCWVLPGE
jgi:putative DNA primase/helicase